MRNSPLCGGGYECVRQQLTVPRNPKRSFQAGPKVRGSKDKLSRGYVVRSMKLLIAGIGPEFMIRPLKRLVSGFHGIP